MSKKEKSTYILSEYDNRLHRFGRITTIFVLIVLLCIPASMMLIWGVKIDLGKTALALMSPLLMFLAVGTIEVLTLAPILGPGGTYISFNTGNTLNLKMPAAVSSLKLTPYEPGSKEAGVVQMVAICVSTIVTMVITFLGMLFISAILPFLEAPALQPGFSHFMPALLGALVVPIFLKDLKTAAVPMAVAAILTIVLGYSTVEGIEPLLMPFFLAISVGWKYMQWKKAKKKAEANPQA